MLEQCNDRYFALFSRIRQLSGDNYVKVVEGRPMLSHKNVVQSIYFLLFSNIFQPVFKMQNASTL